VRNDIYIRADGSSKIGLGHIVRCTALAQMLKEHFEITFVCKEIPEQNKTELEKLDFKLIVIDKEEDFLRILSSGKIVVLDGYDFDTGYQKKIKLAGCKLVCIDDLHDKEFVADLIINHAPGVKPEDYKTQLYTQFALGLDYALLRPAFIEQAKKDKQIKKIETLLICFGGADFKNLTESTLQTVLSFKEFNKIVVVTGSSYTYLESLPKVLKTDSRIEHFHSVNEEKMLSLLIDADLAIVPASGILFEALAAGCKIVSGMYVQNQQILFEQFKLLKVFESAGHFESNDLHVAIAYAIKNSYQQIKFIDGKSGRRILYRMMYLVASIREVEKKDCDLLFEWANNEDVRKNAISKEPIVLENHIKWFNSKINSLSNKIFILEFNDTPIGQIRYDKQDEGWLIDYSVDFKYRGLGFGKMLIEKTLSFFKEQKIKASVKKENIASENVFRTLKFKETDSEIIENEIYMKFELNNG
jgi:UDP-2,4-diacetamido-2,4,6-trideoxy-beta-L-altropyranose hydrolase